MKRLGYGSSIVAPVHVSGCMWGVLAVTARLGTRLTVADELRLTGFGDLLATAIGAIEDRAKLAAQASSDPLTGLANHRTLQQQLADQVATAAREHRTLAVVVLDIDHFKQINDIGGSQFSPAAVGALVALYDSGVLTGEGLASARSLLASSL